MSASWHDFILRRWQPMITPKTTRTGEQELRRGIQDRKYVQKYVDVLGHAQWKPRLLCALNFAWHVPPI